MTWFTETPWPPAFGLLLLAVVCGFAWSASRRGAWLVAAVGCVALIAVVFAVERAVVTPAEEVEAHVAELREAVVSDDPDAVLAFFSPTAVAERVMVRGGMAAGRLLPDVHVTDLAVETKADDTLAESTFRANGTGEGKLMQGSGHVATRWHLSWRKEGGAWRVYEVRRLDPVTGEELQFLAPRR